MDEPHKKVLWFWLDEAAESLRMAADDCQKAIDAAEVFDPAGLKEAYRSLAAAHCEAAEVYSRRARELEEGGEDG